jgi:YVTN family beta-propeller protein
MSKISTCATGAALTALSLISLAWADGPAARAPYAAGKTVSVGAPDRWDYLTFDPETHRLYLSHGDRVDVLDGRTGELLGKVTGIPGGTHGIGIVGAVGKGYTDDGKAGEVVVFDLKTFMVLRHIKGQPDADGIVVDPKTQHVFVVNGDSGNLTVVDPQSDKVIATVNVGGGLEFAVADGRGEVYVNGEEKRELVRIDTGTSKVNARWPIPDCESAHGLAIDTAARRLFVSCANSLMIVVDADSGAVVNKLPIGRGTDAAAFDPKRKLAFSSNGVDGTISVIRENSPQNYTGLEDIHTAVTGRTMSLDPDSGRLYVAAASIDPKAPVPPRPDGRPGRPQPLPDSLKVLFFDPADTH